MNDWTDLEVLHKLIKEWNSTLIFLVEKKHEKVWNTFDISFYVRFLFWKPKKLSDGLRLIVKSESDHSGT